MDDDEPVDHVIGAWPAEVQSVITWLLSGEGDEHSAREALIRMLRGNLPFDIQTTLALAFDPIDGKTILTLGRRGRGNPLDDIDITVRRAVAKQIVAHIEAGGNRKAAIIDVVRHLKISRSKVEELLKDYIESR